MGTGLGIDPTTSSACFADHIQGAASADVGDLDRATGYLSEVGGAGDVFDLGKRRPCLSPGSQIRPTAGLDLAQAATDDLGVFSMYADHCLAVRRQPAQAFEEIPIIAADQAELLSLLALVAHVHLE